MTARVPGESELHLGPVRLPACRLLWSHHATGEPVAWITRTAVPEPGPVWSALSALHGETGLVPVLEPAGWGDDLEAACGEDRTDATDVDRVDAAAMLEHRWIDWSCSIPVPSPVGLAAVLRSWEERFGTRLFALTHDQAWLLVERPPRSLDAALPVAAEHFVFCDEPAGRQSVRTTAAEIIGAPIWYFWWD